MFQNDQVATYQEARDHGRHHGGERVEAARQGNGVTMDFSRPGRPTEGPFIESFNGSFRDECLNIHWFLSLEDDREKIEA